MDSQHFENSTLSAPDHSSRYTIITNIDPGPDSNTKLGDTIAGTDSSSRECVFEQSDPGHSDMLHTTATEHVQIAGKIVQCPYCPSKFSSHHDLKSHLLTHSHERPYVCTTCGKAFRRQNDRKRHEKLHSRKNDFVCRAELSAQDLALISARQSAPTGSKRLSSYSLTSNDSGYGSALHLVLSEPLVIPPVQVEPQTDNSQEALPYYGSLSSLGSQVMPSPPLDLTDVLTYSPNRPEASKKSEISLEKTILSGDEPDCEGFSRAIESSGQIDSQETSKSEGPSSYKVRHVGGETIFAQEKAWEIDGNGHLSDNPEGSLSPDESSLNSGSENGNNDSSVGSILNCSQRALISRLMDEICSSFFYQVSHRPQQRGQGGQGSRDSSSSSTEQTITTNSFIGQSHGSWRKRSHNEGEDPEEEDGGKYKRPRIQKSDDGHSTRARYFACPFHKFDASTYSSGNADPRVGLKYRSCGPPGWPNIGKLKEHLYRNHQTPIHCPRCWTIMKTEAALGEHARARNQCDVLPPPLRWIPREVCEKLKNRKKAFAGQTEEDTWKYIFGLLFPDCPNVPSPYYNDGITLEEMTQRNSPTSNAIAAYEEYARAHLPRLFEEALETAVAEQTQPIEVGLRRSLAGMVRDCQTRLAQDFLRYRSSNMPSTGGTGVQAEVLPSFYIEPLSLAEDIASINPTQISTSASDRSQTHSDSGYASVDTLLNRNSSGLFADPSWQDNIGSLNNSTSHGIDINGGSDFMPGSSDWTAMMENDQDDNFFGNGLCDESM